MRFLKIVVWPLALILCVQQLWAKKDRPPTAFTAPGFEFSQVDEICVMVNVDISLEQSSKLIEGYHNLDAAAVRGIAGEELDRLGYQATSDCTAADLVGEARSGASHWFLTLLFISVYTDAEFEVASRSLSKGEFMVVIPYLVASLYDAGRKMEVWKDAVGPLVLGLGDRRGLKNPRTIQGPDYLVRRLVREFPKRKLKG
jgi:hypothetical protein